MLAAPSFAAGAGAYLSVSAEPPGWMVFAATGVVVLGAVVLWRTPALRWPAVWAAAFAIGFAWALLRADWANAPRLDREGAGELSGVVVWLQADPDRPRLTLRPATFERRGRRVTFVEARVRFLKGERPAVGDHVRVLAVMRPPPPPVAPDGYDFQRTAYFDGVGAVGFAIGEMSAEPGRGAGDLFAGARTAFRDAIYRALPDRPQTAGVIAALTVGDRSGVAPADDAALRASGLAHLLAISGLHLGLAASAVYLLLRALLALPHGLALRFPVHKFAAVAAILAAAVYLGLSGAAPPAQRAFVMVVAGMIAVLTDRLRSCLWFVAWGAIVVVLIAPDVVAGPSFQLSFAAATAIVAGYEAWANRRRGADEPALAGFGRLRPVAAYVAGLLAASLIATAATTPLALAHFQQAPLYGVVANLAAMPVMAFVVMPFAVLSALLAPVGLMAWPLWVVAWGVEAIIATAHLTAGWPGGVIRVAHAGDWPVAMFFLGLVLITALRGRFRLAGVPFCLAAAAGLALAAPPDLLVDGDGRLAAVVRGDALYVTTTRAGAFEQEAWRRYAGVSEIRPLAEAPNEWAVCDDRGCVVRLRGWKAAVSMAPAGLGDDCRNAGIVIALHAARLRRERGCAEGSPGVDATDLSRDGAHAVWLKTDGARIETVRGAQGARPWSGWRDDAQ